MEQELMLYCKESQFTLRRNYVSKLQTLLGVGA